MGSRCSKKVVYLILDQENLINVSIQYFSRLRASRVLIVGVRGLGAEVSKNIVLAGVREVTLLDHTSLGSGDSAERFLMQCEGVNVMSNPCPLYCLTTPLSLEQRAEQAVERLQRLNPNVLISADTTPLSEKNDDFFTRYDVVIATCCTTEELVSMVFNLRHLYLLGLLFSFLGSF